VVWGFKFHDRMFSSNMLMKARMTPSIILPVMINKEVVLLTPLIGLPVMINKEVVLLTPLIGLPVMINKEVVLLTPLMRLPVMINKEVLILPLIRLPTSHDTFLYLISFLFYAFNFK